MSILIIDDSKDDCLLLQSFLESAGYRETLMAESFDTAFQYLSAHDPANASTKIDLILLDVVMPGTTGIQACRRIKAIDRFRDIPIIMVSVQADAGNLQLAFAEGAIDYIRKPVIKAELLARVRSVLKLIQEMARRKAREQELLEVMQQLEAANRRLQQMSSLDGLTEISNRRRFDEFFQQEWKRAVRDAIPFSLILFDVDFFKTFNDTYGHLTGDECLKRVAGAVSGALNRPGDLAARYGGDEFVVGLPGTPAEGAARVAEAIRQNVEALEIGVTLSLGVATMFPDLNALPETLIAAADEALFQAKQDGRNRVRVARSRNTHPR
ncbi:MAG: GGDEF domain-containing response regulator [Nitrospiraceae bacterium]